MDDAGVKVPRVRAKKRLGQHFLVSKFHAQRIAEAVPAESGEAVVEIGPGAGALSVHLVRRYPALHLVEVDTDLIEGLKSALGPGEWTVHVSDIRAFDFSRIGFPLHVVGNLPYNIGAYIIKKTLLCAPAVRSCTFMVQREVAERIAAAPGSKKNGFLSIFCGYFGETKILFRVPPGAFVPPPKVESAVFRISVDPASTYRIPADQWDSFFRMVDKGFSQRRKMLAKVLGGAEKKEQYREALLQIGVASDARAENLGVEEWIELFRATSR